MCIFGSVVTVSDGGGQYRQNRDTSRASAAQSNKKIPETDVTVSKPPF